MLRSILVVAAALVVAFVVILVIELAGTMVFPFPEGVDPMNSEQLRAALEAGQVPFGSMLFVLLAYVAGSFVGGWIAARYAPRKAMLHALVVGVVLTLLGVMNLVTIPHPVWMAAATLFAFVPPAWLGGRLAGERPGAADAGAEGVGGA